MPRTKKKPAEAKTTTTAKAYRHTRTGAVRHSTSVLGYPYEAVDTKVTKVEDPPGDKAEEGAAE